MTHLTAGDILPLAYKNESTYGTPSGDYAYYADLKGDSGNFTPTDAPNPYVAWRSGSRTYNNQDYVRTDLEAGYTDVLEASDKTGWDNIIKNAIGGATTGAIITTLPSRTMTLGVRKGTSNAWDTLTYYGCKTDRLEIRCDQPGGIVEFDETVMASYGAKASVGTVPIPISVIGNRPVQWVGGVTVNGTAIYPQNLRLTINNNLGRVKGPVSANSDKAGTVALVEGRQEIELAMDVWMEDLAAVADAGVDFDGALANAAEIKTVAFSLGISKPANISGDGYFMADGQHPGLVQDKQMQTLRFRMYDLAVSNPA